MKRKLMQNITAYLLIAAAVLTPLQTYAADTEEPMSEITGNDNTAKEGADIVYTVLAGKSDTLLDANGWADEIKSRGIDTLVVFEGGQFVVQCGIFAVRENADKVVSSLSSLGYSSVVWMTDSAHTVLYDTPEIPAIPEMPQQTAGEQLVSQAREYADIMIRDQWTYSNSNNKMNWYDASNASKKVNNCALFVSHVLQATGHLGYNQTFYFKKDGSVVSRKGGWETLMTTCDIMMYSGVSVQSLSLCIGDILCYNGHVNIFTGYNADGTPTWIDAGTAGTMDGKADSPFTNKMYRTSNMSNFKVYAVIRPK